MAVTVNDIWLKTRVLIDEYTEEGAMIPESEIVDLRNKSIVLSDMAQKELFRSGGLFKTFEFLAKKPKNLLNNGFEVFDFIGDPIYIPNTYGINKAKSYFFEVNGQGTARIEEQQGTSWETIITIPFDTTITTQFKGTVVASNPSNLVRLVFDGTTHYFYSNMAFYDIPYAPNKIPQYKPFYRVEMPSDFKSLSQIIKETASGGYENYVHYRWEGFRDLYVNYRFEGNIRIQYSPVPDTLVNLTDVLQIDDITAEAIPYYVAARLSPFEQAELVSFFEGKYQDLKTQSFIKQPSSSENIVDVYGGFDCG